ncbi:MAG: hypothetical protein J6X64_07310 [Bacteroidales bacterium]|nr:hypothetical protein [Bacteroidales bacterium]
MKKKVKNPKPRRTMHLDARVTQEEFKTIKSKAYICGLTISDYIRRCALGHRPKRHLTDREIKAYCSIYEARRDLINIANALRGRSEEEKLLIFSDVKFMQDWTKAASDLIVYWDNTVKKMKE